LYRFLNETIIKIVTVSKRKKLSHSKLSAVKEKAQLAKLAIDLRSN